MPTWATLEDVQNITGKAVTSEDLAMAEAVIEIYSNRTPMASATIGVRDLYWMKQATAWEAAWLPAQPGYTDRSKFKTMSQDGLSVSHDADWEHDLAPMAARSLRNLSWKGERTKFTRPPRVVSRTRDFMLESSDEYDTDWRPL